MVDIEVKCVNSAYNHITCSESIAAELKDAFAFQVPGYQFSPQYKAKRWNGYVYLFSEKTHRLYAGLNSYLEQFAKTNNYTISFENTVNTNSEKILLEDLEKFVSTLKLPSSIVPHDYQMAAALHGINSRRAILLSPTASGKSLIIYLMARYMLDVLGIKKVLVIVPITNLVDQLYKDFEDYGYDSSELVHKIYASQSKIPDKNKQIVVSTWQSLYDLPVGFFNEYDAVIGDECHLFKAKALTGIMTKLLYTKFRIGTTGTLDGTKTHRLILEGLFGDVKKVISTASLISQNKIAGIDIKCLILKYSEQTRKSLKNATYQEEIQFLVNHDVRNRLITKLAMKLEGNTLILFNLVEKHGEVLYNILEQQKTEKTIHFISGKVETEEREEIRAILEKENNAICVASSGTFSTGINVKNLHNIIFAAPTKSRIRTLQSIGRGLRRSENKTQMTLYDLADDLRTTTRTNYTLNHFLERIKYYTEETFPYKIIKLDIKDR